MGYGMPRNSNLYPHPNLPPEGEGRNDRPSPFKGESVARGQLGGGWVDSLPLDGEGMVLWLASDFFA